MRQAGPRPESGRPAGWRKEVRQALLRRPELVEPGVLLQDQRIALPHGRKLRLHGVDVLGRPCLVGVFWSLDAVAYDWMLAVLCAFRDGLLGGDPVYSRGREPRLFVVAPWFRPEDLARLSLLDQAAGVRALRLRRGHAEAWETDLVLPRAEAPGESSWLAEAPAGAQGVLRRLRAAAGRGVRRAEFQGAPWPMVLVGARGPVAALHLDAGRLLYLAVDAEGGSPRVLDLGSEGEQDAALDHLLRVCPGVAHAS